MPRGRPKKNTEAKPEAIENGVNQVLERAKNQFESVIVVGLRKNGTVDAIPSDPRYPVIQWLLNRATFELLIHEKNALAEKIANEEAEKAAMVTAEDQES